MIYYAEINAHFGFTLEPVALTDKDRAVVVDYLNYKISNKMDELEDENSDFVERDPLYYDDYFYNDARDYVIEELEEAAANNGLVDYFEDEIPNADSLEKEIVEYAKKEFNY